MDFVNTKVSENACVVFSKSYCPYCTMAKDNLTGEGGQYVVFELDQMSDGAQIQAALQDKTGVRTVPQVFLGGKFIGGGDDTTRLRRSGQLKKLLQEAGALK